MLKRCPTCGRSSADTRFYGEFCSYCTEKKLDEKLPEEIELTVCKRCGMVKSKGAFRKQSATAMEEALSQQFKGYKIRFISNDDESMVLEITDERPGYTVIVRKSMPVNRKKSMCDRCNKVAGSYYEAVIQLRGSDLDKMDRFIKRIERYFEVRNEFITKVKKADNGLDVYLSNKKLAASYLSSHDIKAVTSYTLYGLKQGKKVYRHTYAVRI